MKSNMSLRLAFVATLMFIGISSFAGNVVLQDTSIGAIAVNGGTDVANPGTTCIQVTSAISAVCASGFVAIPNNNRELIAAALTAKSVGNRILLYYSDTSVPNHCPGFVMTPCTVISILVR